VRNSKKRFSRIAWGASLPASADSVGADLIARSIPILANTIRPSSDPHRRVGDVLLHLPVARAIESGVTLRVAAGADNAVGGSDPQRSAPSVGGSLLVRGTAVEPVVFTSEVLVLVRGETESKHGVTGQ
jgi:hypothetical protein